MGTNGSGFIASVAGELFFQHRGLNAAAPLVCIHGGPGFTCHYLEPLFDLATDVGVVCYDQAGCGRTKQRCSERQDFSVAGFVAELEALREHLGISQMHLLGHSFGGLIAGEYALRYPAQVASIVFACVSIDVPRWVDDAHRLISGLPMMQRMVLREGLRSGAYSSPAFVQAYQHYVKRHIYGFEDLPESIIRSEAEADSKTYQIVWGPNEIAVTGIIRDYSMCDRLPAIAQRALFVCGRYDEATPEAHQHFSGLVPGSRCHVFERSAHHPQITERDEFLSVVRDFVVGRS